MKSNHEVHARVPDSLWFKLLDAAEYKEMTISEFVRDVLSARLDGREPFVRLVDLNLKLLEAVVELARKVDADGALLANVAKVTADTATELVRHVEGEQQFRDATAEFAKGVGEKFESSSEHLNRQTEKLVEILQKLAGKVDKTTDFLIALCFALDLEVEETEDGRLWVHPKG